MDLWLVFAAVLASSSVVQTRPELLRLTAFEPATPDAAASANPSLDSIKDFTLNIIKQGNEFRIKHATKINDTDAILNPSIDFTFNIIGATAELMSKLGQNGMATMPKIYIPDIIIPEVKIPDIPKIVIPAIVIPEVKIYEQNAKATNLPQVIVPKFVIPEVVIPKVEIPDMPAYIIPLTPAFTTALEPAPEPSLAPVLEPAPEPALQPALEPVPAPVDAKIPYRMRTTYN